MQAILRHVSWICRTPRQLRSASCGYVERPASFAPALVDMSNAPPASLHLSWIYRTPRQLCSGSCGYVERSASFAPQSVAKSTGRLRFTAAMDLLRLYGRKEFAERNSARVRMTPNT